MGFSRQILPTSLVTGSALDSAMVGIGMLFSSEETSGANIEDTVLAASKSGMVGDDLRVLSVLVTWLGVHHERLNADRLVRIVDAREDG